MARALWHDRSRVAAWAEEGGKLAPAAQQRDDRDGRPDGAQTAGAAGEAPTAPPAAGATARGGGQLVRAAARVGRATRRMLRAGLTGGSGEGLGQARRTVETTLLWDRYFAALREPKVKGRVPHADPE